MCIALPGKLIEIDENGIMGKVDFHGNMINVTLGAVDAKVGDYVLVHAGSAIEVIDAGFAEELMALFAEIEAAYEEEDGEGESLFPLFRGDGQP